MIAHIVWSRFVVLSVFATLSPVVSAANQSPATSYRVGVAKVDVTPERGVAFQQQTEKDKGTRYTDLHLRVVTITDGTTPVVFVGGEFLYWNNDVIARVRQRLADQHRLTTAQILLNATHTHNGPMGDAGYNNVIVDQAVAAVSQALATAKPARIYFGLTQSDAGVNRRRLKPDGTVRWGINPWGEKDDEVLVLKAVDAASGKTTAP